MSNRTTWLKRAVLLAVCQLWLIVSPSPTSACDDAVTVTIDGDIATVADCSVTYFHASGVPAGGQYQWEVSGGEILAGENGELMCFKAGQTPGPAWVKVTYTYENEDANDKDEFNIVVVELIAVEPNGAVIEIGQSMTFQAVTNPAEYKYLVTWQISSSLEWVGTNPEQGTITVRGKAADEQAYVRARCGCGEPKTANVRVRPHVGVGLSGLPSTVAACAELELKAVGTPSGGTYEWDWSGGDLDDQGDGNAVFTVQEEPGEGYVTVTYRVQDIECNDTREFEIVDANMAGVEPNCKIIAIGTTTTFTARTDPSGYESGVVWRVEDANSLEICGSPSGASLTVRGVQSGENLGVVAEAGCDSEATASVTVIRVKDLQVETFFHKATEVPPDSNNYVVCTDEGADPNQWFGRTWIIAFFDPDVWLDDSNLVALVHWTGAEQDEENPDQASIPLNAIGHRTVTVTCGTSHATVDLWFIKMNSMTVQDAGGSGLSRTVPDDANDLYIPEGAGGATAINLGASFEPSSAGQYVRWEVEGDGAEPNSGTFAGGSPAVTLRPPPEGDRTYTVRVGLDDGQGGFVQGGCPVLELKVYVVRIARLDVSGASASPREPNVYIAPVDPTGNVEITAVLTPNPPDHIVSELLAWYNGNDHPSDPRKRVVARSWPGETTVTAEMGPRSLSVTIKVVGMEIDDHDIWWLGPCDVLGYTQWTDVHATGVMTGEFCWMAVSGSECILFEWTHRGIYIGEINTVTVVADSGSTDPNDVQIRLFYDGVDCGGKTMTVRQPKSTTLFQGPSDYPLTDPQYPDAVGWKTQYALEVRDQFYELVPNVKVGEGFRDRTSDWPGQDWPDFEAVAGDADFRGIFIDYYERLSNCATPMPTFPNDPNAGVPVDHCTQWYFAGCVSVPYIGPKIKEHTLQRYRGRARQE